MAEAAGNTLRRTDLLQQLAKVLVVFRLELGQALQLRGHIKRLPVFLLRHMVEWGAPNRRGRSHQLACWRPDGRIPAERLQTGLEILLPVPDEAISFQGNTITTLVICVLLSRGSVLECSYHHKRNG